MHTRKRMLHKLVELCVTMSQGSGQLVDPPHFVALEALCVRDHAEHTVGRALESDQIVGARSTLPLYLRELHIVFLADCTVKLEVTKELLPEADDSRLLL
eukprot:8412798-Karenia_brevis.AAC.1